jgi:fibronectin type 3 domain-containing protein
MKLVKKRISLLLTAILFICAIGIVQPDPVRANGPGPTGSAPTYRWENISPEILYTIAYGNGVYVGWGPRGLVTSTDLVQWTVQNISSVTNKDIAVIKFLNGKFIAGTNRYDPSHTGPTFMMSEDGVHWQAGTTLVSGPYLTVHSIAYGDNKFVAVASDGIVAVSTDGLIWTASTPSLGAGPFFFDDVAFINGRFVGVGALRDPGTSRLVGILATSVNGVTWTDVTYPSGSTGDPSVGDKDLNAVTGNGSKIMAFGYLGAYRTDTILSPNVPTVPVAGAEEITSAAYDNIDGGTFVGVGFDKIITSLDLINWRVEPVITSFNEYYNDVTNAAGTFVAAGEFGIYKRVSNLTATTTTVSASPNPAVAGSTVTLTATVVSQPPGGAVPTGTVTFTGPGDLNETRTLNGAGQASLATTTLLTGTITATYSGDGQFSTSTGTFTITVNPPTYSIAPINNLTPAALTLGYSNAATQTVGITNTGTGSLTGLTVALSGVNADDFILTQPQATLGSGAATSFTVKANNGLAAGTYAATVTVSAANLSDVTLTITQVVNLPDAPANPQNVSATGGNRQVTVSWDAVTGATYYNLYMSTASGQYGQPLATVTDQVYTVQDLTNGVGYYFMVKAGNPGGLSAASNEAQAEAEFTGTTTTVTAAPNPAAAGSTVTLTATVVPQLLSSTTSSSTQAVSGGSPSGTITFTGPGGLNETVALNPAGQASLDITAAAAETITATYNGDGQFSGSTGTVDITLSIPDAPAHPQNVSALGGNRQVTVSWDSVTGATYYNLYMSTSSGQFGEPLATVTDEEYTALNLTNGTAYYFVVKAGNAGGVSTASSQVQAVAATVPGAPSNVTAAAGDRKAVISFTAPSDNGGSSITEYEVTASPGDIRITGTDNPITVTGLTNGASYTFTVRAFNRMGGSSASAPSNTVIPRAPFVPEAPVVVPGPGTVTPGTGEPGANPTPDAAGVSVLVNGKEERAGTVTTAVAGNQTVTTVTLDQQQLEEKLKAAGQGAVVTIPVSVKSDVVVSELNGQMVKSMEDKQTVLEIKTALATYTLPAGQIDIDAISRQLGSTVALQDIKVEIRIAAPAASSVKAAEDAAGSKGMELVAPPVEFTVTAVYGDVTVEVSRFQTYVERLIPLPEQADPNKITTGVVVDPDGELRHVPTQVAVMEGKYYAQINSLNNSMYAVVWNPVEFQDVSGHWARAAVNDMGSRLVIDGTGNGMFNPDENITRAEFAAIMARGLGLKSADGIPAFTDVAASAWYHDAVQTAYQHKLIDGFEDGTFRPDEQITREQAMVILAKAMEITGLAGQLAATAGNELLKPFADADAVSGWAKDGMIASLQAGIVSGRSDSELAPKASITRAEVAAIVQRLLKGSGLI